MHYIDDGISHGISIVFLHGNPTSIYLWRNLMPYSKKKNRIIAVDSIGMGNVTNYYYQQIMMMKFHTFY